MRRGRGPIAFARGFGGGFPAALGKTASAGCGVVAAAMFADKIFLYPLVTGASLDHTPTSDAFRRLHRIRGQNATFKRWREEGM